MPNKNTIKASQEIENILSKLWEDGDITLEAKFEIMDIVRNKLGDNFNNGI